MQCDLPRETGFEGFLEISHNSHFLALQAKRSQLGQALLPINIQTTVPPTRFVFISNIDSGLCSATMVHTGAKVGMEWIGDDNRRILGKIKRWGGGNQENEDPEVISICPNTVPSLM